MFLFSLVRDLEGGFYTLLYLPHLYIYNPSKQSHIEIKGDGVGYRIYIQIQNMIFEKDKVPLQHLFKANELFRKKDYSESLSYYNKALTSLNLSIDSPVPSVNGIATLVLSLRGLNYCSLRDYERAEKDYDSVLRVKPTQTTTLHRRATMFLKIKAYEKAAADIAKLYEIEPDSIRVAALVMQIKEKSEIAWREEQRKMYDLENILQSPEIERENLDEEEQEGLNFSNLKQLERVVPKRVSLKQKVIKPRISLVEFKEDQFITYEDEDLERVMEVSEQLSAVEIKGILEKQEKELEMADKENVSNNIVIVEKRERKKHKSILKCSIMHSMSGEKEESALEGELIDVTKVVNIDGKPIKRKSSEVKFRTSKVEEETQEAFDSKKLKEVMKRKSSIKPGIQPYQLNLPSEQGKPSVGRASFLGLKNTDGKIIRKSLMVEATKEKTSESGSSDGEEYNIYGKDQIENIDQQIKQVFGGFSHPTGSGISNGPKKSILKIMEPIKPPEGGSILKPKKSVLFR